MKISKIEVGTLVSIVVEDGSSNHEQAAAHVLLVESLDSVIRCCWRVEIL